MFIGEQIANQPGVTLHKFTLAKAKAEVFVKGAGQVAVSGDGKKLLFRSGPAGPWCGSQALVSTTLPP
ncbi:MAG: hypothetical protein EXR94_07080 [Gemmatimonadetes bacterium]|nr:hypothetical protein [Gemmatimonadota bacterium]